MGKFKFELKCKFCYAVFDWPDEGWINIKKKSDLNQYVIICPGVKKNLVASHCEVISKHNNMLDFDERFYIMEESKN
jgi:hypothetical protein